MFSWLKNLWFSFVLYKEQKKLENELNNSFSIANVRRIEIFENDVEQKYHEGINELKRKLKQTVTEPNKENYEKALAIEQELLKLATKETEEEKQMREVLEKIFVNVTKDIKTENDKTKMIEQRISDFYKLQDYNEERALIKNIRQAEKLGNKELVEELKHEWKQRFRPTIH